MTVEPMPDQTEHLDAARELVIRAQPGDTVQLVMDQYISLFGDIAECQENVDFWSKRLAKLKGALAALMGDATVGTIGGEPAVTYEPVDRFNSTEFKKKHPNMFQAYQRTIEKKELDVAALKLSRPELYAQFQVRPLRVTYQPPGTRKPE